MKKIFVWSIILLLIAAGVLAALQLTGKVDFKEVFSGDLSDDSSEAFYVSFMDDFFVMDENGCVIKCTSEEPSDIPRIEDLRFDSLILGNTACAQSESTFEYVQEVCSLLDACSLSVEYISASDGQVTLYLTEDLSVQLGEDDETETKIKDLSSLYSKLMEYDGGVLYMTTADTMGSGYTFREISSGTEDETGE